MPAKRRLKHLPKAEWPADDVRRFNAAFEAGDIFDDDRPAGGHLSHGTRRLIEMSYRRWLQFLADDEPETLGLPAEIRITPERIRRYVAEIEASLRKTTLTTYIAGLAFAARLIAPTQDWRWLAAIKSRIAAQARPINRLPRLHPPWELFHLGKTLMDGSSASNDILAPNQFRDGLIIALLALWPIRRRSIAALTVDCHVRRQGQHISLDLFPEDTKAKRAESFTVPVSLKPYLEKYLDAIRPGMLRDKSCTGLWVSSLGNQLNSDAIYKIVRTHTREVFGEPMGLHDIRRSAATFLAIEAPETIGLIPQVLHHTTREVSDRHYNLAGSAGASRRFLDATVTARQGRK